MEKKFKVTKKTVLKNVVPESFETTEQWVKDNKRFAKHFIIEEIEQETIDDLQIEKSIHKAGEILNLSEEQIDKNIKSVRKMSKKNIEPEKQIEKNEEII
jgi:hypothetical protein